VNRSARRSRGSLGQATVELALLLPVVVLLVLAVLQVGLLVRDVVLVTHAAREGARAAATEPSTDAARAAVLASSGLDPDRVAVTLTTTGVGSSRRAAVEVVYRAPTGVPLVGGTVGDRLIRARVTMRVEVPP
jgi:Flp pilus assembly protein TadG